MTDIEYLKLLQPTFVKEMDNEERPGKYYFSLVFPNLPYVYWDDMVRIYRDTWGKRIMTENIQYIITEESESQPITANDLPRIYLNLDSIVNNKGFMDLFLQFSLEDHIPYNWLTLLFGIDGFRPGEDYWFNNTIQHFCHYGIDEDTNKVYTIMRLDDDPQQFSRDPKYVCIDFDGAEYDRQTSNGDVITFWLEDQIVKQLNVQHLSEDCNKPNYLIYTQKGYTVDTYYWETIGTNNKDLDNINYFYRRNIVIESDYTEDEINNFYSTFCKVILNAADGRGIQNADTLKNQIYKAVLEFWANGGTDETNIGLNLILNSNFGTTKVDMQCGCQANNNNGNLSFTYSNETCADLYKNAMTTYLKTMLGDLEFYKDWFVDLSVDGTDCYMDEVLIDSLEKLINALETLGYDISFQTNEGQLCPNISFDKNKCNYGILDNYIQVLEWVRNQETAENKNKIKVYGEAFGELLPKLNFN